MEQVWYDIDQNNFVVLKLLRGFVKVLKADDLITFERARHHGLVLEQTPLDRLDCLLGCSIVFGHKETPYWLKPLGKARLIEDFFNNCLKTFRFKALFDLGISVYVELIVSKDQVY